MPLTAAFMHGELFYEMQHEIIHLLVLNMVSINFFIYTV